MRGNLLMSAKERERKVVMEELEKGRMTQKEASGRLGVSERQVGRILCRYRAEHDAGLVHRNRGKSSNRKKDPSFERSVIARYEERYTGFGPTLASEKLREEGLAVDHETLRRWLIGKGLWQKERKRSRYRQRRVRKSRFGELVQMDGSFHRWFGPERPEGCLMNMVDDATGTTLSLLGEEETTGDAFRLLLSWIKVYGIPQALYLDRKSTYYTDREPTREEELEGKNPVTAFGRACEKLGIRLVTAWSPQAKGRVERNHAVYQDRLVKELALEGITTKEEANRFLNTGFIEGLNRRFAVPAMDGRDGHRPLPPGFREEEFFCWEEPRVVQSDYTVRYGGEWFQIGKTPRLSPKDRVLIRTLLDGSIQLVYENLLLSFHVLDKRPEKTSPRKEPEKGRAPIVRQKPDHPWKRSYKKLFQARLRQPREINE